MTSVREIKEGRQEQGIEEEITYTLTVPTSWGVPTTDAPTVKVYSYTSQTYSDVTSTVIPAGSASVTDQVITLPEIKSLTEGITYRVEVKFNTSGGNVLEAYAWLEAKR